MMTDTRVGHTFGHEFIGVVDEVGSSVQHLQVGDRVIVPFNISCGRCYFCARGLFSNCHNVNANATGDGALYGYSATAGAYHGGQAEFVRVPSADVGPTKIPDWMSDEDAVLLTDATLTAVFGAQLGDIAEGDTVVVSAPGQLAWWRRSGWLMGAGRVIVVDRLDYRLEKARLRRSTGSRSPRHVAGPWTKHGETESTRPSPKSGSRSSWFAPLTAASVPRTGHAR
jgi:S-(hydroxymethyl)glutathione dehydrogenase / alcohol dehydrogenase